MCLEQMRVSVSEKQHVQLNCGTSAETLSGLLFTASLSLRQHLSTTAAALHHGSVTKFGIS